MINKLKRMIIKKKNFLKKNFLKKRQNLNLRKNNEFLKNKFI